ncbi:MAG: hypothetical protein V4726_00340 [Verrucomicrobiota bacterium]
MKKYNLSLFLKNHRGVWMYLALAACLGGPLSAQTGITHPIGYVTLNYPSGYSLVNVQFGDNSLSDMSSVTVTTLLTNAIWNLNEGSVVQRWDGTGYSSFVYHTDNVWTDPSGAPVGGVSLQVGEGLVVWNPGPSGSLVTFGYIYGGSGEDEIVNSPVPVPPPGIYLRGGIFPVGPNSFEIIMGRPPVIGDAVMKLTASGDPLISRYTANGWVDPEGGHSAPFLNEGESAFFDTSGGQFLNFQFPNAASLPEPGAMALMATLTLGWSMAGRRRQQPQFPYQKQAQLEKQVATVLA